MLVFKFGGASVKNSEAVKNIVTILNKYKGKILVVVSAMGKTTNALERLTDSYIKGDSDMLEALQEVKTYHYKIADELFKRNDNKIFRDLDILFDDLERHLHRQPSMNYDFEYDQIVSYGEIISTLIVSAYLNDSGCSNIWTDIRNILKTDSTFRDAKVNIELSSELAKKTFIFSNTQLYVTQGFIGSDINNQPTTLGREGSDYTAAMLAYIMDAENVTIWKDVPGVLNADPKHFSNTLKLNQLSYSDAIELTFYGASVIHPKTIKPLQNKNIPLLVKSFLEPDNDGTIIKNSSNIESVTFYIVKEDQILLRISPKDFSFVAEESLSKIFGLFTKYNAKINLMQNSAICFKVCVNNEKYRIPKLLDELKKDFNIELDTNLQLVTIRNYTPESIEHVLKGKKLLLEQKDNVTIQLILG